MRNGGAGDAREIDAPVIFEVLVLDGGDRVVEDFGDLLIGHEDAALESEAADHLAVVGVDFGDYRGAIGFEGANFGEVAGVDEEESAGGAERDGAEEKEASATRSMSLKPRRRRVIGGRLSINRKV